ncbi:hypothetical protein GCM10018953_45070 [Streptosporangium nondiastaticum]|uniref:DUF4158 domain-containing protein n=1 Tax=Streptosporangium nondiastaticum TaxID=35764 RepID=UPI0031F86B5D
MPWPVAENLAAQLKIEDVSRVKEYTERLKTAYEHAWEIRDAYGYHPFEDHAQGRRFRAFPHGRAWTAHAEGHEIRVEDIVRLSPLKHRNLNVLGRCSFTASVPREGPRPPRDPDAVESDDDDDGRED